MSAQPAVQTLIHAATLCDKYTLQLWLTQKYHYRVMCSTI